MICAPARTLYPSEFDVVPTLPAVPPRSPFRWVIYFLKNIRRAWKEDCLRQAAIARLAEKASRERESRYALIEQKNLF